MGAGSGVDTQPVLVLRFEASSQELLEEYRHQVEEVVEEARKTVVV